jgi:inner membrane protein
MDLSFLSKPELFWFVVGMILFLLELVVPGFVIFFFGIGAWLTALVCLITNPGTDLQIIIFAITSVFALIGLRRIIQRKFFFSKEGLSEAVEDEFTGKEGIALTDFGPDRSGKVEFKGTTWKAEAEADGGLEIKENQKIIIVKKDNFKLIVKPKK